MHRQPSDRSFSDFSQQSLKKKTVKGTKDPKAFHKTSSCHSDGQSSSSLSLSSPSPSYHDVRNTVFHFAGTSKPDTIFKQPFCGNMAHNAVNYTFDAGQHKKILQMLNSNIKETTWSCRQCLYTNNALHVNVCERCKSSRSVLVSHNFNHRSLDEQLFEKDQPINFHESEGDTVLEDQSWTCRSCTLINNSNVLSCEACGASKLQSLSISEDMTLQKGFWLCPLCTLENSSAAPKCATCKTARIRSKSVTHSQNGKNPATSKVKLTKPDGMKRVQNCAVPPATVKGSVAKDNRQNIPNVNYYNAANSYKGLSNYLKPWICSICTFENSVSEVICDMCKSIHNSISGTDTPAQLSQEEIADLQWNYTVSNCKVQKKLYIDETFPAVPSSLYYASAENKGEDVKWLRLRNVTVEKIDRGLQWVVFRNLLEPSDVCQGVLGDCWFISALSVLVEREDLVRAIVITKQLCPQGVYQVRLCKDGNWTVVTVDDLFPCDGEGLLLYSPAIRKQLWVPLIEKAFAKMNGCYEALTTGNIAEGLATLTGAPCENIPLQATTPSDIIDADLIWAQLVSSRQALFLMGTVCGGDSVKIEEAEFERRGFHPCHVYSILDVQCISGRCLLQLRDPCEEFVSYYSPSWTSQLRAKLPANDPKNGVFWIDFDDVLKYFSSIGICKIRSGWHEMRLSGVLPPLASQQELPCFSLTIHEPTEIDLILYQNSQRETETSKRTQMDLCVVLLKAKGDASNSYSLVTNSIRKIQEFVGCYKILEPAEYIIMPLTFNHWHSRLDAESYPRYVLAIHSSKKLSAEHVTSPPQALGDTIILLALVHGEPQELLEHFTVYYLIKNFSGAAIIAENKYKNKWVHLKCDDDKESYNVISTRGLRNTVDSIPPMHRQVVAVFTQLRENARFFTSHKLDYRAANSSALGNWGSTGMLHIPEIDYQTDGLHVPRLI